MGAALVARGHASSNEWRSERTFLEAPKLPGRCQEIDAERLMMDDLDARRFARRVGLELISTLGLLLAARLDGRIASLQREIENLEGAGFRVAPKLVERLLMEAGEGTA
jgi:uncharacterized small protein (DUF1192 family)